ncbi:hypothetical protein [Streptomyces sp. NPDC056661]|uniref:hypothetical protein n=1 Tax=Streptomyces sp. NPDC056661 TaxID=3345898 RepID=UPI0036C98AD0
MGSNRDDFDLEFGPTNVATQAVATNIELGDAGVALDIGGARRLRLVAGATSTALDASMSNATRQVRCGD